MMMDTAVQQQTDPNGQVIITQAERQSLIQKLAQRWPMDLSTKVEKEAFEKSNGLKQIYIQYIQKYYQHVQTQLAARASQQQQQMNNTLTFSNPQTNVNQQPTMSMNNPMPQQITTIPRFATNQTATRMVNPLINNQNPMTRLREPQRLNPTPMANLSYVQSQSSMPQTATAAAAPTIDLSQLYASQQLNNSNPNEYTLSQPRLPTQPSMNIPRQRLPIQNQFQPQQSTTMSTATASTTNPDGVLHQFLTGNPTVNLQTTSTITNSAPSTSGDQLLQKILSSNVADPNANKMPIQTRQPAPNIISQQTRPINPPTVNLPTNANPIRASLSPSPSVVNIPPVTQPPTVQIQPSTNITVQQSPLSNSNGPYSANSQSTNNPTPVMQNYSSPLNRNLTQSANGNLSSPDDEISSVVKYLKENANRLQLLVQKFTNENNPDKLRQVQAIQQQIVQFVNNPTYETLPNAKHFRDILERITNRTAQLNPPPPPTATTTAAAATTTTTTSSSSSSTTTANLFTQCLKATTDFLSREPKERLNVTKRYLEPLTDVINGVPHKIMRLDDDSYPITKVRCTTNNSLLTKITDEINQLPKDIFSIERISDCRTRKSVDNHEDNYQKTGIILRCKLLDVSNPILPPIRLHVSTKYPDQVPEILSLTKTMPPKLDFSDGHPFFDQISSIFVSHLFKLRAQHTITEILNIWRQSVQTAL